MKKIVKTSMVLLLSLAMPLTSIGLGNVKADGDNDITSKEQITVKMKEANAVALMVDTPHVFFDGKVTHIDEKNHKVITVIKDDRTLVPVRVISEKFGAEVAWDDISNTVTVKDAVKGINIIMTIGSQSYKVNGEDKTLDVPAATISDRTMVPLRAMAEALTKKVFWDDGLIVISEKEDIFNTSSEADLIAALKKMLDVEKTSVNAGQSGQIIEHVVPAGLDSPGKIKPVKVTTNMEPEPKNHALNAVDGKVGTRWSAEGECWIIFDLGSEQEVSKVGISFWKNNERTQKYDLEYSLDNQTWQNFYSGEAKKDQNTTFTDLGKKVRYIRLNGHGNTQNKWTSILEFDIYSADDTGNASDQNADKQLTDELATQINSSAPVTENSGSSMKIEVVNEAGTVLASQADDQQAVLEYNGEYLTGDKIVISAPQNNKYLMVQVEQEITGSIIYVPDGKLEFSIPFDQKASAYNNVFTGDFHQIEARIATDEEIYSYRNIAFNPIDKRGDSKYFPHATANLVTRDDPIFEERNAIDGWTKNDNHGKWPYQSWGAGQREDIEFKLDFGREVEIDKVCLILRADVPHDVFWKNVTLVFSDGTQQVLNLADSPQPQEFKFSPKKISWIRLTNFKQVVQPLGWAALTEIEVYGKDLAYAEK